MQHQCTAALFKAKCNPYCSVLLCKTGPQQALSHCIYTYGDLLLIQVCSDPAPLHCSTAARAKCTPHCSVVLCKRGPQQALSKCIYTYREICSSYRCAVMQHQSTAALVRARCKPHCSVMLCKTGSQQAVWHCIYTCGDLILIQVFRDPTPMHCCTVQGKMQSLLFSAALQNRPTAGTESLHSHLWRSALDTGVQ